MTTPAATDAAADVHPLRQNLIVIAGGGIVGCATAYYLRKFSPPDSELKILVLEQEHIACHSSGKAAGFLAVDWHASGSAVEELAKLSFRLHEELAAEFGSEKIGYRRMKCVGAEEIQTRDQDLLRAKQDEKQPPAAATGGGMHRDARNEWLRNRKARRDMGDESSLAQVHPRLLTEQLFRRSGADWLDGKLVGVETERSAAPGTTKESVCAVRVEVPGGAKNLDTAYPRISCRSVVFCLGAWSFLVPRLFGGGDEVGGATGGASGSGAAQKMGLQILSDTVGQKYTSVMVPSPQPLDNTAVFVDSDHNVELYPRPNNVLYACGCPERLSVADLETKFSCAEAILPEKDNVDLIKKEVEKNSFLLSPSGGGGDSPKTTGTTTPEGGCSSPQVEATACVLPSSMDGGIVLGQIEATDNAFVGCGHTCWGILNGPGSGCVLAKLVLDEMGMKGVGGEQVLSKKAMDAFSPGRDARGCGQQ